MVIVKFIAAWYLLLIPFAIWNYGKFGKYSVNCWLSVDQLLNTFLGGDPDMTLSGRMGRDLKDGRCFICKPICWLLDKIQINHCANTDVLEKGQGRDQIFGD